MRAAGVAALRHARGPWPLTLYDTIRFLFLARDRVYDAFML